MNRKLIFLDVDGTLTAPGAYVPPESAVRAVKKARELGHKVFLCSGRNHGMLAPLHKYGFDGGIASCGGYVYAGDKVIYDCPLTEEQQDKVITLLSNEGVFLSIEGRDYVYSEELPDDYVRQDEQRNEYLLNMLDAVWTGQNTKLMTEYDGCPLYKVVYTCRDREQLKPAIEALGDELQFIVHDFSEPGCIFGEIINRKFDKGSAVRKAADALGFDIADTIGFGDSRIDIEMIEAVGTSVCMENGSDFLKERSDIICPSTDEDGIEWAFRRLGLI
jgi:Cof subfamily protein (haloacid dehalogenase superfamily)